MIMTDTNQIDYITGVMVQYYVSCPRELWFFAHRINMNREDENILIGRRIHEESYPREKKGITIGPVSFDFTKEGERLVVHEMKKSRKLVEPALYQLYYYLWFLRKMGIEAEGCLNYPKEKRRRKVILTERKEREIEQIIRDIKGILSRPSPPPPINKSYCKNCSYFEFCRA